MIKKKNFAKQAEVVDSGFACLVHCSLGEPSGPIQAVWHTLNHTHAQIQHYLQTGRQLCAYHPVPFPGRAGTSLLNRLLHGGGKTFPPTSFAYSEPTKILAPGQGPEGSALRPARPWLRGLALGEPGRRTPGFVARGSSSSDARLGRRPLPLTFPYQKPDGLLPLGRPSYRRGAGGGALRREAVPPRIRLPYHTDICSQPLPLRDRYR